MPAAFVLVATVGGTTSNSYLTRSEANTYAAVRFGSEAYTSETDTDGGNREKALVQATADLDQHIFRGYKNSAGQALQFPRTVQVDPATQIPADVKRACFEQALFILQNKTTGGRSQRQALRAEGVQQFTVGGLQEVFAPGMASRSPLCGAARHLINRWIARTGRLIGPRDTPADVRPWYPFT